MLKLIFLRLFEILLKNPSAYTKATIALFTTFNTLKSLWLVCSLLATGKVAGRCRYLAGTSLRLKCFTLGKLGLKSVGKCSKGLQEGWEVGIWFWSNISTTRMKCPLQFWVHSTVKWTVPEHLSDFPSTDISFLYSPMGDSMSGQIFLIVLYRSGY